jgi:hypothetical protein
MTTAADIKEIHKGSGAMRQKWQVDYCYPNKKADR